MIHSLSLVTSTNWSLHRVVCTFFMFLMIHSSSPSLIVQSRNISSSHARRTHGPEYTPPTQPYPLRMNRSGARGTSTVCSTSHTSALSPPSALDQRTPPAHPGHVVLHQPCISACHACTRSETGSRSYATSRCRAEAKEREYAARKSRRDAEAWLRRGDARWSSDPELRRQRQAAGLCVVCGLARQDGRHWCCSREHEKLRRHTLRRVLLA